MDYEVRCNQDWYGITVDAQVEFSEAESEIIERHNLYQRLILDCTPRGHHAALKRAERQRHELFEDVRELDNEHRRAVEDHYRATPEFIRKSFLSDEEIKRRSNRAAAVKERLHQTEVRLARAKKARSAHVIPATDVSVGTFLQSGPHSISFENLSDAMNVREELERALHDLKKELQELVAAETPPEEFRFDNRFQGTWIISPPKGGKTNLLSWMIRHDLDAVASGAATVIVMDGQGGRQSLVRPIARYTEFAPGGALDGRLLYIGPRNPVRINPFLKESTDEEVAFNAARGMFIYFMESMLGAPLSINHITVLENALELIFKIPDATMYTLMDVLQVDGWKQFQDYLPKLNSHTQQFLRGEFNTNSNYTQCKPEIVSRIQGMLRDRTFRRMFADPRSTFNLTDEINSGKCILIDADKNYLQERCELFGKFFISLVHRCALARADIPEDRKIPCYFYIDECQDFIKQDLKIPEILEQARKQNIGLILGNQFTTQITEPRVRDSVYAVTATKLASRTNIDLPKLATALRCEAQFILNQPAYHFVCYTEGMKRGVSKKFPYFNFSDHPMTEEEWRSIQPREESDSNPGPEPPDAPKPRPGRSGQYQ